MVTFPPPAFCSKTNLLCCYFVCHTKFHIPAKQQAELQFSMF
jgi:hypothetical protein